MPRTLFLLFVLLLPQLVYMTDTENDVLSNFLNETNNRLAGIYDLNVLVSLQHEVEGSSILNALILLNELNRGDFSNYIKSIAPRVAKYKRLGLGDPMQRRQLARIPVVGYRALPGPELITMYGILSKLSEIQNHVRLCVFNDTEKCDLKFIPDMVNIMHASQNLTEIEYYWNEWRLKAGQTARKDFEEFIRLYKKTAMLNGFPNASDYWYRELGASGKEVMALLERFMQELRPLFLEFHAHVRGSLGKQYGTHLVPPGKPYPQHLSEIFVGNAYRSDPQAEWFVDYPFKDVRLTNITDSMLRLGLSTTQRIYWNVAEYFRSIGLPMLEEDIWLNAKPKASMDIDDCWHKAWQYYTQQMLNLTYCPLVDEQRFFNMFEALSDIYYYKAAQMQPTLLREEPLPNFSDALGKMHALSASSPRYLQKLKLVDDVAISLPARLNRLYIQGLQVIFLLPVFYVLDRYRVDALESRINATDNAAYWRLTTQYTGAVPPSKRTNAQFDVPAKLLLEVDDQYASQIISTILQYQLYKHFCLKTGEYVPGDSGRPLDLCDLSDHGIIGDDLLKAMALGASKTYKDVLYDLTKERDLSLDGLLTYFRPLQDWLVEQNRKSGLKVGW